MIALVALIVRGGVPWLAAAATVIATSSVTRDWRMPIPLNEVGATSAVAIIQGLLAALLTLPVLAREQPLLETLRNARARAVRAGLLATTTITLAIATLVGVQTGGGVHSVRTALSSLVGIGLGALSLRTSGIPSWLAPIALVCFMLVFGVDRDDDAARPWAWLLAEQPAISTPQLLAYLTIGIAGVLAFTLLSPRTDRDEDAG